ncbi:MAG TPA: MBL fold metallo-hydrolase [Cytophagaceae bacterium]
MKNLNEEDIRARAASLYEVTPDITGLRILFTNVYFIGAPGPFNKWVLVDAGLQGSANRIKKTAEDLYGKGTKPEAIVLTHGHFDHVGALPELLKEWDVPVYAHPLELPYLTGKSKYPPSDPGAGGGALSIFSWIFPIKPINISQHIKEIPSDGIPELPGWKVINTPGHSPGHVSLFRERDRVLIAGDAFCTVNQSSLLAVMTQEKKVQGPPRYFTIDWQQAKESVERLSHLYPTVAATGHGIPMAGTVMQQELGILVDNFETIAIPQKGHYYKTPAKADRSGITNKKTPTSNIIAKVATAVSLALITSALVYVGFRNKRS